MVTGTEASGLFWSRFYLLQTMSYLWALSTSDILSLPSSLKKREGLNLSGSGNILGSWRTANRVCVMVITVLSILWIPAIEFLQGGDGLLRYFVQIKGRITPAVCAVYLLALLWPRANEKGAFWGLMAGAVTGFTRLILDFVYPEPLCWQEDTRPMIIKIHYFYFNLILFSIVLLVDIIISLLTEPPPKEMLIRTTFWTRFSKERRQDEKFEGDEDVIETEKVLDLQEKQLDIDHDSEVQVEDLGQRNGCYRLIGWFCGYRRKTAENQQKAREEEKRIRQIKSIEQDPRAKIFIYINMSILIGLSVFMYIYFSVDWI